MWRPRRRIQVSHIVLGFQVHFDQAGWVSLSRNCRVFQRGHESPVFPLPTSYVYLIRRRGGISFSPTSWGRSGVADKKIPYDGYDLLWCHLPSVRHLSAKAHENNRGHQKRNVVFQKNRFFQVLKVLRSGRVTEGTKHLLYQKLYGGKAQTFDPLILQNCIHLSSPPFMMMRPTKYWWGCWG